MSTSEWSLDNFLTLSACTLLMCALALFVYEVLRLYLNRNVQVECWFCQSHNTVNVGNRNSYYCSACDQYNGFTESGDYNRQIPGQYFADQKAPRYVSNQNLTRNVKSIQPNYLCNLCNERQAYKIEQIARFEPSSESKWEEEFRQFKQELESRCSLCARCTLKVHNRINDVDMKILPNVLAWWRTRYQNPCYEKSKAKNSRFISCSGVVFSVLRVLTFLFWLSLSASPFLDFIHKRSCYFHSTSYLKGILSSFCDRITGFKSLVTLEPTDIFKGLSFCLLGNFALVLLHVILPSSSPFSALPDVILVVLAACLIICNAHWTASSQTTFFTLVFLLVVCFAVLLHNWLRCAKANSEEKGRSDSTWPSFNSSSPSTSLKVPYGSVDEAADVLSLDGLSLHGGAASSRRSLFTQPILFSHSPPSAACSHPYAASAAPGLGFSYSRRQASEMDAVSHFTSVSQWNSPYAHRKKRDKRRNKEPRGPKRGLLRWMLYLLFGRLETWADVRAELLCLFNAVLVGSLLVLVCHFFYSIIPLLWKLSL